MSSRLRLFWAITLPEEVKEGLDLLRQKWSPFLPGAKWVERENFHLTVKFLGEVDASLVPALGNAVAQGVPCVAPFVLELGGWGVFGNPPRVLWVGVGGDLAALEGLWRVVEEATGKFGFAPERHFTAHVTLARLRRPQGVEALRQRAEADLAAAGMPYRVTVSELHLMQSHLTPRGPHYTSILRLHLGR